MEKDAQESPLEASWMQGYGPWFLTVAWIGVGVAFGCVVEGWSIVTSCYVITQIITTVGYGDVTPSSPAAKIFLGVYVLITIVFMATIVTECAITVVAANEEHLQKQIEAATTHVLGTDTGETSRVRSAWNDALVGIIYFIIFVTFGTVFYSWYEGCSCSYGRTLIENCIEGPQCHATGGSVKTWQDSLYMSLITLTTVGFGDYSPKSQMGRAIGCVWMFLGVAAAGNMVGRIANARMMAAREQDRLHTVNREIFKKLDLDGDGTLSRYEFRSYTLLKFGLVTKDDLDSIDNLFDAIDQDKSNAITYDEIEKYHKHL